MKSKVILLTAASLLLTTNAMRAQRTPPTPAEMAQRELQRYTAVLALTSAQQTDARAIFTAEATSVETLQASERGLHQTLDTAVTSDDVAGITQAATSLGQSEGQVIAARSTARAQFINLLTADQRTRFAALANAHMGRGPGGPGGAGGPPE